MAKVYEKCGGFLQKDNYTTSTKQTIKHKNPRRSR